MQPSREKKRGGRILVSTEVPSMGRQSCPVHNGGDDAVPTMAAAIRGPQNGLGSILKFTLPIVFSQRDAEKGHPRVGCW